MEFNNEEFWREREQSGRESDGPKAWHIEDDREVTQDVRRPDQRDSNKKPVMEGVPSGGHNFGKNNNTSAANDKNNPSRYAGNANAYLSLTEPLEEHPENSNFKMKSQEGWPDYDSAQPRTWNSSEPKPERVERGNGENDRPHKGETSKKLAKIQTKTMVNTLRRRGLVN
jgi:hypothetical protein